MSFIEYDNLSITCLQHSTFILCFSWFPARDEYSAPCTGYIPHRRVRELSSAANLDCESNWSTVAPWPPRSPMRGQWQAPGAALCHSNNPVKPVDPPAAASPRRYVGRPVRLVQPAQRGCLSRTSTRWSAHPQACTQGCPDPCSESTHSIHS